MIPYETRSTAMHTSTFKERMVWDGIFNVVKSSEIDPFKIFLLETFEYLNLRAYMNKPCMHLSFENNWMISAHL